MDREERLDGRSGLIKSEHFIVIFFVFANKAPLLLMLMFGSLFPL